MSQCSRILEYLQAGKTLTRRIGLDELGIWETPARISELKRRGVNIEKRPVNVIDKYGQPSVIAYWTLGGEA